MERKLFREVYRRLGLLGKQSRPHRCQWSDVQILAVFFWAVLHDRPIAWACQPDNGLAEELGWTRLPSGATLSRRLKGCRWLLDLLEGSLRPDGQDAVLLIDARPLEVGFHSKDADTKVGRGAGHKCRGYKLFTIWDLRGHLLAWAVWPMNVDERAVAGDLIRQIQGPGYLVGDKMYDVADLYDQAARRGRQLIAPKVRGEGLGHRRQSPHRLASLNLQIWPLGRRLLACQKYVEVRFGQQCTWPLGLKHLPAWVRRWPRVRRWVQAKLIVHALWRQQKEGLAA